MTDSVVYTSWDELIDAFRAEEIFVDVSGASADLLKEFIEELNQNGVFFPSKSWGEMPFLRYMYYDSANHCMYTCRDRFYKEIKDRAPLSLAKYSVGMVAVANVDHESFDSLL